MIATPTLHALEIVPRTARPGDIVSVRFRARNHGPTSISGATVRFFCDDALLPLGETSVAAAATPPGDDLAASLDVRLPGGFDDGTRFGAHAVLALPDRTLQTNVATVILRCRPAFGGSACGTTIEPFGSDGVRVVAAVTNEGDGPARDVTLRIGAPFGTRAYDGAAGTAHVERLDPGQTLYASLDAAIVEAFDELRAGDVVVRTGDGAEWAIPARNALALAAALDARVDVRTLRLRSDLRLAVTNAGWADALEVPVRFTVPAPLRLVEGSLAVDGVPLATRTRRKPAAGALARVDGTAGGPAIVIARVPARTACTVTLQIDVPCDEAVRTIAIDAGGTRLEAEVTAQPLRDVRLRIAGGPSDVVPGATAAFVAELANHGDRTESLQLRTDDDWAADDAIDLLLPAGTIARVARSVRVPDGAHATERRVAFVAAGDAGEAAHAERRLRVHATTSAPVPPHAPDDAAAPAVRVHIDAPAQVTAGAAFAVRTSIDVLAAVDVLRVRAAVEGACYAGGSTAVDGRALLDRPSGSPLTDGLTLRDVAAGTRLVVGWSSVADTHREVDPVVVCDVVADDAAAAHVERSVVVNGGDPFALRTAGEAYAIDALRSPAFSETACAEAEPILLDDIDVFPLHDASCELTVPDPPEQAAPPEGVAATLSAERSDALRRDLRAAAGAGLAAHLVALRALVPDDPEHVPAQAPIAARYAAFRAAQLDVLDRLFVKLRIPGFSVTAADVEDTALRDATIALHAMLPRPLPDGVSLADAPLGAPQALRAQVALIPRADAGDRVAAARDGYAAALDAALARYAGAPLELFDCALAAPAGETLDDAHRALLAACDGEAFDSPECAAATVR